MPRNSQDDERLLLLTDLVYNTEVLSRAAPQMNGDLYFPDPPQSVIEQLCFKYFTKYNKAPAENIEAIVIEWANKGNKDANQIQTVELLTERIIQVRSKYESEKHNEHAVSRALSHLAMRRAKTLSEELENAVSTRNVERIDELISGYEQVSLQEDEEDDPFDYDYVVNNILNKTREESLITYPGDAEKFFSNLFHRRAFVLFEGQDKVGKSIWLADVVWRSLLSRRRVAYFESGDLGKEDAAARLIMRMCRRPISADRERDYKVEYPTSLTFESVDEGGKKRWYPRVDREVKDFSERITAKEYKAAYERLTSEKIRSKEKRLRLIGRPTRMLRVDEMRSMLVKWKRRHGWVPDVIALDYADILSTTNSKEFRQSIDTNWGDLRSLAIEFDACMVTATQSKATVYGGKKYISHDTFSDDKRKNAHITVKIGLNQTDSERDMGVMRLNVALRRNGPYNPRKFLYCAGCMAITNPIIRNSFAPSYLPQHEREK